MPTPSAPGTQCRPRDLPGSSPSAPRRLVKRARARPRPTASSPSATRYTTTPTGPPTQRNVPRSRSPSSAGRPWVRNHQSRSRYEPVAWKASDSRSDATPLVALTTSHGRAPTTAATAATATPRHAGRASRPDRSGVSTSAATAGTAKYDEVGTGPPADAHDQAQGGPLDDGGHRGTPLGPVTAEAQAEQHRHQAEHHGGHVEELLAGAEPQRGGRPHPGHQAGHRRGAPRHHPATHPPHEHRGQHLEHQGGAAHGRHRRTEQPEAERHRDRLDGAPVVLTPQEGRQAVGPEVAGHQAREDLVRVGAAQRPHQHDGPQHDPGQHPAGHHRPARSPRAAHGAGITAGPARRRGRGRVGRAREDLGPRAVHRGRRAHRASLPPRRRGRDGGGGAVGGAGRPAVGRRWRARLG